MQNSLFNNDNTVKNTIEKLNAIAFDGELSLPLVACDDGYAQINFATFYINAEGTLDIWEGKIPSIGQRGRQMTSLGGGSADLYTVHAGDEIGDVYTISKYVPVPEDTRSDDYGTSALNLCLNHAALNALGLDKQHVALATTLPVAQYMDSDDGINRRLVDAKIENLKKIVTKGRADEPNNIVDYAAVFPEAVCGLIDYMCDAAGMMREDLDPEEVRLGIDIGGNTTDLVIVLPGFRIGAKASLHAGVNHVKDRLRQLLITRFGEEPDATILEKAVRTRSVSWWGEDPEDVSAEYEEAVKEVLLPIKQAITDFRKQFPSLSEMVGFGGGVALMEEQLRAGGLKKLIVMPNADGANARGALKMMILTQKYREITAGGK